MQSRIYIKQNSLKQGNQSRNTNTYPQIVFQINPNIGCYVSIYQQLKRIIQGI